MKLATGALFAALALVALPTAPKPVSAAATAPAPSLLQGHYMGLAHSTTNLAADSVESVFHVSSLNSGGTFTAMVTTGEAVVPVVGKLVSHRLVFEGDFANPEAATRFHLRGEALLSASGKWLVGATRVIGKVSGARYADVFTFCLEAPDAQNMAAAVRPALQDVYEGQFHSVDLPEDETVDATFSIQRGKNGKFTGSITGENFVLNGSGKVSKTGLVTFFASARDTAHGVDLQGSVTGQLSASGKYLIGTSRVTGFIGNVRVDETTLVCLMAPDPGTAN